DGWPSSSDRPESARGRRRCTLQRRSPDRSDTGRSPSRAGTAQDAPQRSLVCRVVALPCWGESGHSFRQLLGRGVPLADIAPTGRGIRNADYLCRNALFHCRGGLREVASVPRRSRTAHGAALRLSSIIRLEGTMRVFFLLPPLLVAGAALGGLFAPFAVGSAPTDSIGIAAPTERQFGADVAICHGSASAGVTRVMLHLAQTRTEVPQAEMQAASPAAAFADTDPPLWEGLGGGTDRIPHADRLAQAHFHQTGPLTH